MRPHTAKSQHECQKSNIVALFGFDKHISRQHTVTMCPQHERTHHRGGRRPGPLGNRLKNWAAFSLAEALPLFKPRGAKQGGDGFFRTFGRSAPLRRHRSGARGDSFRSARRSPTSHLDSVLMVATPRQRTVIIDTMLQFFFFNNSTN